MSIIHGFRCDSCGRTDPLHPDDGPPAGWYLVARMEHHGTWDDGEWHLCGYTCLRRWATAGGHA